MIIAVADRIEANERAIQEATAQAAEATTLALEVQAQSDRDHALLEQLGGVDNGQSSVTEGGKRSPESTPPRIKDGVAPRHGSAGSGRDLVGSAVQLITIQTGNDQFERMGKWLELDSTG